MCVYVCVCVSKPWWIRGCLGDGQAWQAVLIETLPLSGPGPLIWWRQRQREREKERERERDKERERPTDHKSNEGSWSLSPQCCPAMLGHSATLSSPNLPSWDWPMNNGPVISLGRRRRTAEGCVWPRACVCVCVWERDRELMSCAPPCAVIYPNRSLHLGWKLMNSYWIVLI